MFARGSFRSKDGLMMVDQNFVDLIGFQILSQIDTIQSCFIDVILFEIEKSI